MQSKYRKNITLLAVLSLSVLLTACGGKDGRQAKYLERAQTHFEAENYEKALIDTKNVLQINPNNVRAHFLMAQIAQEQQEWRKAFGELNYVLERRPDHVEAAIKLANLLIAVNDKENARIRAEAAYELAPDNAEVLSTMAAIEFSDGNRDEAMRYAALALEIDPASETPVAILAALAATDEPDKAMAYLDAGIKENPESERLRQLRMRLLLSMNRTDDVVGEYKALIEIAPDNYAYVGQLSEYLVAQFRSDEALALLRDSVAGQPESTELKILLVRFLGVHQSEEEGVAELLSMVEADPENYQLQTLLAQYYVGSGATEKAEALYEGVIEADESSTNAQSARYALSSLAIGRKDYDAASLLIEEMLERESANPDALLNRAAINHLQGDYQAVIPDLRLVLRSQPDSIKALLMLAEAQQRTGARDLAMDNYRTVLSAQPDNTVALFQSAMLQSAAADYDGAIEKLEKLLALNPQNIAAINALTGLYSQQERWDDANDVLNVLEDDENTRPVLDLLRAGLELRRGDYEKTLEFANSAIAANPQLLGAVPIAARAYAGMGDLKGAIGYVAPYLEQNPENVSLSDIQAQLFYSDQQVAKAEDVLLRSIEAVPERTETYLSLARIYLIQGKSDEVIALYEEGLEADPENMVLRAELALRYQLSGDYNGALQQLEKAYEIDPNSQVVANNLSALLLDHFITDENLRRVKEMTFGFDDSGSPPQLDTLGWLQYRLGNLPQAISLLEAAQANGGQGLEYWYHLGMAYAKNGQKEQARVQLGKVLESENLEFVWRDEAERVYQGL